MTIFGAAWSDLTAEHVQRVLDGADDEPLLWEAKGTTLDKGEVRRQVGAFANGHEHGYLILGASHTDDTWKLDGLEFPDEPQTWISNVIADEERGVRPRPHFEVAAWQAPRGHLAVIRVTPTSTPPCIAHGTVHERIPGKTQTVRDPVRLSDLFARGDRARRGARQRADNAASTLLKAFYELDDPPPFSAPLRPYAGVAKTEPPVQFAVALATTGNPPNIAGRLFQNPVVEDFWDELRRWPSAVPADFRTPQPVAWSQDALFWQEEEAGPVDFRRCIRASWDGAVAVGGATCSEPAVARR